MFLYNIIISIYSLLIKIVAQWNPKAKLWCDGRVDLFERMRGVILPSDRVIWIHVASLGEFEQGRPLIEKIRFNHPEYKILLTFFSPSGYEIRKDYKGADYIFYLPIDTTRNARKFLDIAHPEIAVFVKYEYWLNLLFELRRRNIRSYIISAIFRPQSIFFRWWGFMWRKALESFETIFVQDENSIKLLAKVGFDNVVVAGDTRFDRVADIARAAKKLPTIERFKGDSKLLVAGSTWLPDEKIIVEIAKRHPEVKIVIAPHEINEEHIIAIEELFEGRALRFTEVTHMGSDEVELTTELIHAQVLILDTMGMLSSLYQYGDWAYIGGGFGVGIHNTLEAATFAIPIAFGPNYLKFKEAVDMVSLSIARSINDIEGADEWFSTMLNDEDLYRSTSRAAREYTNNKCGATNIIERTIIQ